MSATIPLPVDTLLEQLHLIGKRRVYTHQAVEEHMRAVGNLWADVWELDVQEQGIFTALQALGVTINYEEEEEVA